jgi:hypothetical protein
MINTKNILVSCALLIVFCFNVLTAENTLPLRQQFEKVRTFRNDYLNDPEAQKNALRLYMDLLEANRKAVAEDKELTAAIYLQLGGTALVLKKYKRAKSFLFEGLDRQADVATYKPEIGDGCVGLITILIDQTTSLRTPDAQKATYRAGAFECAKFLLGKYRQDKDYCTQNTLIATNRQLARLQ